MFFVIGLAVILGMAAVLWWSIKHRRTNFWFFGFSNACAERPILYWFQIAGYAAVIALIAYVVGAFVLAAISN